MNEAGIIAATVAITKTIDYLWPKFLKVREQREAAAEKARAADRLDRADMVTEWREYARKQDERADRLAAELAECRESHARSDERIGYLEDALRRASIPFHDTADHRPQDPAPGGSA